METIKQWIKEKIWSMAWVQVSVKESIKNAEIDYATRLFKNVQDDLKETMVDDVDEKARELAKQLLNDMLSNVDLRKVVSLDKARGIVYIGGERAEDTRLSNLHAEAVFLLQSDLWGLMHESVKELAQRQMFVSGTGLEDMQKGRSILYTLSTQKNIVDTFNNYIK